MAWVTLTNLKGPIGLPGGPFNPIAIAANTDLNTLRTAGWYYVRLTADAATITNRPPGIGDGPFVVQVWATPFSYVTQTFYGYSGPAAGVYNRNTGNAAGTVFTSWARLDNETSSGGSSSGGGLANALRVMDFTDRRGGPKSTGGRGAVALRFDHGLTNFKANIVPLLTANGLPASLALNSRTWTAAENVGASKGDVIGWALAGWLEVWNHGATHIDASSTGALTDEIVAGLTELRAQLPGVSIDGFAVPGVGGTNYGGFNAGATPENFYATTAGQLILENHAVSTGAFPGTAQRVLDGQVRQGLAHFSIEAQTVARIKTEIDKAITDKTGLQLMMHPSLMNTAGYLTTAQLGEVLAYIKTKRDEGTLVVMSPSDLIMADATMLVGMPGPAGPGVPNGGGALQVIRKNAANTTTEWASLTKALVGLSNVDNTSDLAKPVSNATQVALDSKADAAATTTALSAKADTTALTAGLAEKLSTADAAANYVTNTALQTDLNNRVAPMVPPLVSSAIASDPTVVNSAATMAQNTAGLVPVWKASTSYTAGQRVIAPNGDVVSAKVNFTSSTAYSATNWNASTQDGRVGTLEGRQWRQGALASATDLDTVKTPGAYQLYLTNYPNMPYPVGSYMEVLPMGSNGTTPTLFMQRVTTNEPTPRKAERITSVSGWWPWVFPSAAPITTPDAGVHQHTMRLNDLRHRLGPVSTGGKGAVVLVFDHGTNNFKDVVLPALVSRSMRATLALNSQMYDPAATRYATDNATTWTMIKGWHDTNGIEIANHGRKHIGPSVYADMVTEVKGGREELETNLPGVFIDSWVQTGNPQPSFGGFNDGATVAGYWTTDAGRIIIDNHAVITGQVPGTRYYPIDGEPIIGMMGNWIDTAAGVTAAQNAITTAGSTGRATLVRCHPELLNTDGYTTTVELAAFLDWLAARTDVVILPLRELAIARK